MILLYVNLRSSHFFLKENKYFRKFIVRVSTQLGASHYVGNKHCKQNGRFTFRDDSIGQAVAVTAGRSEKEDEEHDCDSFVDIVRWWK